MGIKNDNQITTKLWIIKTFWSIYLQDNHCWKGLNYQKKSLIFRTWIKNACKCKSWLKKPQKSSPKWTKTRTRDRHPKGPFDTFQVPIGINVGPGSINLTFFDFLEIRTRPSSYSNHLAKFSNIPTSINRRGLSKFSTLFHALWLPSFWLFSSFIFLPTLKTFWRLWP